MGLSLAYIAEVTINNHIDATINPGEKGWSNSDYGVTFGANSAILLVRDAPRGRLQQTIGETRPCSSMTLFVHAEH
jgi:hypothetical protein